MNFTTIFFYLLALIFLILYGYFSYPYFLYGDIKTFNFLLITLFILGPSILFGILGINTNRLNKQK